MIGNGKYTVKQCVLMVTVFTLAPQAVLCAPRMMAVKSMYGQQSAPASRCWKCDQAEAERQRQAPRLSNDEKVDFAIANMANIVACGMRYTEGPRTGENAVVNGTSAVLSLIAMIRQLTRGTGMQEGVLVGMLRVDIAFRLHEDVLSI